jgi:hypothetical protein
MEGAAEIAAWGRRIWVFSWDSESCLLGRVTEEEVSPVVGLVDMAHPNGNHVCLYLSCGWPWGMAQQSRDLAGLCRLWGCGWQSRDMQGWGTQPSERELLRGCAGLGCMAWQRSCRVVQAWVDMACRDHKCLWIPGLRAHPTEIMLVWGVGVWGSTALVGQGEWLEDRRSHSVWSSGSMSLWARG